MNTSYKIAYMLRNFYEIEISMSVTDKSNYKDFSETGLPKNNLGKLKT